MKQSNKYEMFITFTLVKMYFPYEDCKKLKEKKKMQFCVNKY